jgi:hypothetical protein
MIKNNKLRGWMAQREGRDWESLFKHRAERSGFSVVRIPDGCRQIGPNKLMRVKTPFDWILSCERGVIFCDTKSLDNDRLIFSKIDQYQLSNLRLVGSSGVPAGYVCQFRETGAVVFFGWKVLESCQPRGSLSIEQGILIGTVDSFQLDKIWE